MGDIKLKGSVSHETSPDDGGCQAEATSSSDTMDIDSPTHTSESNGVKPGEDSTHCFQDLSKYKAIYLPLESEEAQVTCTGLQCSNGPRKMKKDDSGIYIEKSVEDESSDDSGSIQDKGDIVPCGKGKGLQKLDVTKAEEISAQNSPDSGHQDGSYSLPGFPETSEVSSSGVGLTVEREDSAEFVEPPQDSSEKSNKRGSSLFGKRKAAKRPSSEKELNSLGREDITDLDDDDRSTKSDDTCKMNSSDEESYDPTPNIPKPQYKWFLCQEIANRQYGFSNKFSNDLFRLRCCGSLHMVERLELMYKMKKHEGCVNTLHFNATGTKLASGSDDLNIVIWDWTVAEPLLVYDSGHRSNVFQAKFMPLSGDCHIVSCARDGQVRIAELSTTGVCKGTRRLAQHRGPAHKLAIENDSPHIFLSCGEDAVVYEVDLRACKPEKVVTCKENDRKVPLYSIFANPSNSYEFAVGGRDHYVRVYDKRRISGEDGVFKKFCPHHLVDSDIRANVTCLVYNYNGTEILASYNDEDIYTFDSSHSDGAEYLRRYRGHRNNQTVKGVNYFGPKSEYIVSGSDCGYIYVWDRDTGHIIHYLHGDESGVVNCLEPHPVFPVLATSGLDDDVKIWVPSCEQGPDLSDLKQKICANMREREDEKKREGSDAIDGQMLWFLMQQLRRSARHRARMEGREPEESSSSHSDSDSDDEDEGTQTIQCAQS